MAEDGLEIDLSGNHWKFEKIRPGAGLIEGFHELPAEYQGTYFNWNQASVPGDVYTDLQRAGELDDLLMGRNMHRARWAMEYEYWYVCKFNASEAMRGKHIELLFEGVDYSCEVWLNGSYLGRHEGMYSPFSFDITPLTRFEQWFEGCNILMVKLDPPPRNYRRVGGRKFCFAGDYMPGLVPFGIWRPVKVRASGSARIELTRIESSLQVEGATVNIEVSVNNLALNTQDGVLRATLAGETFESESLYAETNSQLEPGGNRLSVSIPVSKARLWWPWDMGEPDLYQVDLELIIDGERQDSRREVFGIREIRMEMNPGFSEDEVENPWTFMINGKRHFLRSACWGGPPSFFYGRNTDKKYSDRLEMVREANINNLRIFGWHPPEIPYFYEFCDRLGISVWTNFSFATQAFEATPEFMEPMLEDCRAIVRERRNHPSNIFWMGGEEVFFSDAHVDSENKLIMEEVGRAVAGETSVPYCPASPMSGEYGIKLGFKPKESAHANEHYYAAAEHTFMEEYYTALDYCVIPELTAASAPSMESLRKFIPMDELWPMGPSWGYHWADISILRILNCEVFGSTRDGSLEDFVASTQLAHGIIAQFALEHFRRRKPRVSAVALCHFLTYLPDIKWGIIDYYGEKKIAFDHVKRAYQPLLPSLEVPQRRFRAGEPLRGEFWVVNDYQRSFEELQLEWRVLNPAGVPVEQGQAMFSAAADSSAPICPLAGAVDGQDGQLFRVEMILRDAGGTILAENFHTLAVGDQERAKAHCVELHREMENEKQRLGKGYYRYHPELIDLD